jgi:hypothetical protein
MISISAKARAALLAVACLLSANVTNSLWAAQTGTAQDDQPPVETVSQQHYIKTVFVIVMENHNWTGGGALNIKGNPLAPYLNYTLLPMASHANAYFNPPHLHPSLPNYLWLEAGTNFGVKDDGPATKYHLSTHDHLVAMLDQRNITWKSYEEGATGTTCSLQNWHDPFVFFQDETANESPASVNCIRHIRPFGELKRDLDLKHSARYNFIVPNLCDSMHSSCGGGNQIKQGDEWLAKNVPTILNSSAFRSGGALFIVFDEALTGDGPIPMLVLSPFAKGNGYSNYLHYTHGSMLRTFEEIFGLTPLLRDAANQRDLRDMFTVFP